MQNGQAPKLYPGIEAFYNENEARRRSPEADFGCWWRGDHAFVTWSVSYIQATGEVYAVCRQTGKVEVLGVIPPDPDERGGNALGPTYYRTLDRILEGWAERCGTLGGIAWVRKRLAQASEQLSQREG